MEKINIKYVILTLFFCITSFAMEKINIKYEHNKEEILEKLSKERYFPYQDIIINNNSSCVIRK